MLYAPASQTVAAGETLAFTANVLNSPTAAIALSGTDGLSLAPGQYLVSFVSDASITDAGTIGAALALDGVSLPYATAALSSTGPDADRIAISAIVAPTDTSVLTVINSSGNAVAYENSTLSVVRLS